MFVEYNQAINHFSHSNTCSPLNDEAKNRAKNMVSIALLATLNAMVHQEIPLPYYDKGFFKPENRGKSLLQDPPSHNPFYGLLKPGTALTAKDPLYHGQPTSQTKPSDQATMEQTAAWVRHLAQFAVHPFSNSVSGTLLCIMRLLASFNDSHKKIPDAAVKFYPLVNPQHARLSIDFFKYMIASLLLASGGHSLYEYIYPLSTFGQEGFPNNETMHAMSLEKLFFENNSVAFDKSIAATIEFQRSYLPYKKLCIQLEKNPGLSPRVILAEVNKVIEQQQSTHALKLKALKKRYQQTPDDAQTHRATLLKQMYLVTQELIAQSSPQSPKSTLKEAPTFHRPVKRKYSDFETGLPAPKQACR